MGCRFAIALVVVVSGILAPAAAPAAAANAKQPNILIFLSDDVGWGEYGFQGGKDIPTPNIDSLAKNGVRFTQGYVSGPYCSPTRAGLMTGRYQTRFGHEFNSVAAASGLSLKETTIADRLKALGYSTCAIGKWHLGGKPEYNPIKRGFDEFYGTLGNTSYFYPKAFVDSRVSPDVQKITDPNFYTTDEYSARALDWLSKQQADKPWFLYFPFNAQHGPLEAPQKYLDRFTNISDKKRQTFAAMMSAMDDTVGRVLAKVRDMGQEENTLIFFFSDNGGPTNSTTSNNGPLRGFKATTWEGGVRIPFCAQWKGQIPAGMTYENPIIQLDLLPTCVAAAGGTVETSWQLDGVDLLPYLKGQNTGKPHETLYWRFGDQWAIRHGDWKLVVGRPEKQPGLFNLAADLGESTSLAEKEPEKVKELQVLWDSWNVQQAPPSASKEKENRAGKKGKNNARRAKRKAASA